MLYRYGDDRLAERVLAVRQFERKGDDLERAVVRRLDRAFITPLDRKEIHAIAAKLEFILDVIEGIADRIELYAVRELTPEILALGGALTEETQALRGVVSSLGTRTVQHVVDASQRLKHVEADMDRCYREGVARLFKSESFAPLEVLKLKEILEHIEAASDECEDVADLVEGIVIKRS